MKAKILSRLKDAVLPYSFFWEEWVANGNCNLSLAEISIISHYSSLGFKESVLSAPWNNQKVETVSRTIRKLELGFQVFKDFVIVNFLQTIIEFSSHYPNSDMLGMPITSLTIEPELKNCLLKFKCHTLHLVFVIYKAEDFNRAWIYSIIVEFQTIKKNKKSCQPLIHLPMK